MNIDWNTIATITGPILALFVGVWVNRKFDSRPILMSYFGHVSSFKSTPPGGEPFLVHTHSVVLKNTGRRSATNVRLSHIVLPDFNIWPSLAHHIEDLPSSGREIVIPTLVPGELITISYLYFPPITVAQVNAGIKCDQGFAHPIPVLLQRQYPQWVNRIIGILLLLGLISFFYFAYELLLFGFRKLT